MDILGLVKEKASKYKQWRALEEPITKIMPLKNSKITDFSAPMRNLNSLNS